MSFDNVRFTKEHEWVRFEDDSDVVTIGITDFAAGELGDIVFIELPEVGREIKMMEAVGTIEAVKTVADLFAPVSGVVKEINSALGDDPALVNQSPYDDGWFLKVELSNRGELDELLKHEDYNRLIGK